LYTYSYNSGDSVAYEAYVPPPAPPNPPYPPGFYFTAKVEAKFKFAGDTSDFGDSDKEDLAKSIANKCGPESGVSSSDITIKVSAASVLVTATIIVSSTEVATYVQGTIKAATSEELGHTLLELPSVTVLQEMLPPEPNNTGVIVGAICGGVVLVLLLVLCVLSKRCRNSFLDACGSCIANCIFCRGCRENKEQKRKRRKERRKAYRVKSKKSSKIEPAPNFDDPDPNAELDDPADYDDADEAKVVAEAPEANPEPSPQEATKLSEAVVKPEKTKVPPAFDMMPSVAFPLLGVEDIDEVLRPAGKLVDFAIGLNNAIAGFVMSIKTAIGSLFGGFSVELEIDGFRIKSDGANVATCTAKGLSVVDHEKYAKLKAGVIDAAAEAISELVQTTDTAGMDIQLSAFGDYTIEYPPVVEEEEPVDKKGRKVKKKKPTRKEIAEQIKAQKVKDASYPPAAKACMDTNRAVSKLKAMTLECTSSVGASSLKMVIWQLKEIVTAAFKASGSDARFRIACSFGALLQGEIGFAINTIGGEFSQLSSKVQAVAALIFDQEKGMVGFVKNIVKLCAQAYDDATEMVYEIQDLASDVIDGGMMKLAKMAVGMKFEDVKQLPGRFKENAKSFYKVPKVLLGVIKTVKALVLEFRKGMSQTRSLAAARLTMALEGGAVPKALELKQKEDENGVEDMGEM